jgi:dTMP kinase
MEAESFHARVEDGYHELIKRDPERFIVVNAERTREEIAKEIAEKVLGRLMEMEK